MSQKVQFLRSLVEQRLTAAAEEVFGLFERTIAEYEEELCRTKEENQRQRQILDCVWNPRVLIHKTDVEQLLEKKEEVPHEQQEWNPIVDQEEPEPEPSHIKEEQEELWISQEADITEFSSTPVPVKSEDDEEENVKFSQHNQTQTEENNAEANKVDCGGSESSSSFDPHRHLQRKTDEQNENCEETEDSDEEQILNHKPESKLPTNSSTEQMETETDGDDGGGSESDVVLVHMENVKGRTLHRKSLLEKHMDTHTGQKLDGSSECEATFFQKENTTEETKSPRDMMTNTDLMLSDVGGVKKKHHCSVCSKAFSQNYKLKIHMRIHTGEKPFGCSVCGWRFTQKSNLHTHMMSHTGEKPHKCLQCNKSFRDRSEVRRHTRIHTGEGFDCSFCGKTFTKKSYLTIHIRIHTGETPFCCSFCGRKFRAKSSLQNHMISHTGEKPFKCPLCQKCFVKRSSVKRHMSVHTGERPFGCDVCQERFKRKAHLQAHMKIHTRE